MSAIREVIYRVENHEVSGMNSAANLVSQAKAELDALNKWVADLSFKLAAAQQRLHLTAIAACGLGVLVGLSIGWFWFGA